MRAKKTLLKRVKNPDSREKFCSPKGPYTSFPWKLYRKLVDKINEISIRSEKMRFKHS
jgi:hypothetical protein